MSHSQFHSTNLFILRHAWLNLWDKHMTTGRINQVTISSMWAGANTHLQHQVLAFSKGFPRWVFITRLLIRPHNEVSLNLLQQQAAFRNKIVLVHKQPVTASTLSPGLTCFKQDLPVLVKTGITAFSGDYHQPAAPQRYTTVKADLQVVIWPIDLAISKQSTSFYSASYYHKRT